jgi:hypothetical protein
VEASTVLDAPKDFSSQWNRESLPAGTGKAIVSDWTFLFSTMMTLAFWMILSPFPIVFLLGYWLVIRKTPARWAGAPWLCLGAGLQAIYWWIHYAPFVPLVYPSAFSVILLLVTASGVWRLARARGFHPWKWSLLACLPVLGPMLAFVRLATRPVTIPQKRSFPAFVGTAGMGYMLLCVCVVFLGTRSRLSATPAPDHRARIVATATHFMDLNVTFEWQRLLGPFVIQSRDIYRTPDERSTVMTVRWSRDSARVLVTGPKFDVVEAARVGDDRLYLLFEVQADRRWTNATADRYKLPRFTAEDVASIQWIPDLDANQQVKEGTSLGPTKSS